jgi:hypothetical protein
MPGFDHQLYNQLKRTDPPAAANMLSNYQRNQLEAMNQAGNMADRRQQRKTASRQADAAERSVDIREREARREAGVVDRAENAPGAVSSRRSEARKAYTDFGLVHDPYQASVENTTMGVSGPGVTEYNKDHFNKFVKLRESDESTQTGKFDRVAYKNVKSVFDQRLYQEHALQDENAEDFADYFFAKNDEGEVRRIKMGIPAWMTRSHFIMAYLHFATDKDKFDDAMTTGKAMPDWDDDPEDLDLQT